MACINLKYSIKNYYILGIQWMMNKKIIFSLDPSNPTVSIFKDYKCYQLTDKVSKGLEGYLIIVTLFVLLFFRNSLYNRKINQAFNFSYSKLNDWFLNNFSSYILKYLIIQSYSPALWLYITKMKLKYIAIIFYILIVISTANRCINNHCPNQHSDCKDDKTTPLPCHNVYLLKLRLLTLALIPVPPIRAMPAFHSV